MIFMDASWWGQAACGTLSDAELDEMFELHRGSRANRAREFCGTCPVKKQCLEYAILYNERGSVWGGMTEAERDAIAPLMKNELQERAIASRSLETRNPEDWLPASLFVPQQRQDYDSLLDASLPPALGA